MKKRYNIKNYKLKAIISGSLRNDFLYFKKSASQFLFYKHKFIQPYDLHRLDKYSSLTKIKREINLNLKDFDEFSLFKTINHDNEYLLALTLDKILVRTDYKYISIIDNKTGEKLYSRTLTYALDFDKHELKSTFSYIAHFYKFQKCSIMNKIEIFDFELNLLNKFELDRIFEYGMVLNNNEIAFKAVYGQRIYIYNCETIKLDLMSLQETSETNPYYLNDINDELLHFDKEKFYFLKYKDFIYTTNRINGQRLMNIHICDMIESRVKYVNKETIFFDKNFYIYFFDYNEKMLKIFDSRSSEMVFKSSYNKDYLDLCLTEYGTVVFKQKCTGTCLAYFEL